MNLVIRAARVFIPSGLVAVSETLRHPQGILLMPSESLADLLHALPVVRALRRVFPETRIAVIADPTTSDLLKDTPGLDEAILCYPLDPPSSWKSFRHVVSELKARNLDTLFSLDHEHDGVKSLVAYLSGARVRVAFGDGDHYGLFNVVVDPPTDCPYLPSRNLALLRSVGIDTTGIGTEWSPTESERRIAEQLADLRGLRREGLLAGFESQGDLWHEAPDLAEFSPVLKDRFGARFVVFEESPPAAYSQEKELTSVSGAVDLACRTIRDVVAILSCCDIFLCRDSNLLHFAVAMGVPTLAFLPRGMATSLLPPESERFAVLEDRKPSEEELCQAVARLVPHAWAGGRVGKKQP